MNYDKSAWGPGPWQSEPDHEEFIHEGLPCVIRRGPTGSLNGYVGVPPGHPCYEVNYDHVDVTVHGGLTYADYCSIYVRQTVSDPEGPEKLWWLGFDTAHYGDYSPGYGQAFGDKSDYRDIDYLRHEVKVLAIQLAKIGASQN